MPNTVYAALVGLLILWALEIRHKGVIEEVARLKEILDILDEEVQRLKKEIKFKQDICENHNPPA